ncbi:MAG: EamA family transporter [Lentisphaeria bacterium]|nr:EamA family transporter [Lentisphaeria bacterium]
MFSAVFKNKRLVGLFCAFLATLFWSCNYPVSRFLFGKGAENLDEWAVSYLRLILALIFLLPFTVKKGDYKRLAGNWKMDGKFFLVMSIFTLAEVILAFVALKYTTAARASLMANASPVFTLIISFIAGREILSARKITGACLGMAGIILAGMSKGSDLFSGGNVSTLVGDLMALSSGIFWSLFTVFGEKVASRYNGMFCSAVFKIFGLVLMIPILLIFNCSFTFNLPLSVWIGLIYLGVFSSGLALALWAYAQKHVEPGAIGAFGYISATLATIFSMIFLKEKLTPVFIISFLMVLGGVALMIREKKSN